MTTHHATNWCMKVTVHKADETPLIIPQVLHNFSLCMQVACLFKGNLNGFNFSPTFI